LILFSSISSLLASFPFCLTTYLPSEKSHAFIYTLNGHLFSYPIFSFLYKNLSFYILILVISGLQFLNLFFSNETKVPFYTLAGLSSGLFYNLSFKDLHKFENYDYLACLMGFPVSFYFLGSFLIVSIQKYSYLEKFDIRSVYAFLTIFCGLILISLSFDVRQITDSVKKNEYKQRFLEVNKLFSLDIISTILLSFFLQGYFYYRYYSPKSVHSQNIFLKTKENITQNVFESIFGFVCILFFAYVFDYSKKISGEENMIKNTRNNVVAICLRTAFLLLLEVIVLNREKDLSVSWFKGLKFFCEIMLFGEAYTTFFGLPYFAAFIKERNYIGIIMTVSEFFVLFGVSIFDAYMDTLRCAGKLLIALVCVICGELVLWNSK